MKKYFIHSAVTLSVMLIALYQAPFAYGTVTGQVKQEISLDDQPRDIVISPDGATAYILCENGVQFFSRVEGKVTDTIPLQERFDSISLSPDETMLFLVSAETKKMAMMQIERSYDITVGKSPVIGKEKAPVAVFAFLDYQCPYCGRVYPVLKQLLDKYPKDVKLVIKHFPLSMHKFADKAAMAALAASNQNKEKYAKLTELLFANFNKLNDASIAQYAQEAGLDMKKFNKDINDASLRSIINADMKLGRQVKVRGVPAIFINGTPARARSLDAFAAMVEEELKKKK